MRNRAQGSVGLTLAATAGGTRCIRTREEGSLRVRFPHASAALPEAVLVNTAGGIAGGDRLRIDLDLDPGARLVATTASAEKVYRSLGADADIEVSMRLGDGAELFWLPQETIMFDRARLARRMTIELAASARLVCVEAIVFGRTAMGESITTGAFSDRWRVRLDGRLVFAENLHLEGAVAARLGERAVAAGRVAAATVLVVPGKEAELAAVRDAASDLGGEIGISAWNGIALARLLTPGGACLRHDLVRALAALGRSGVPRLWPT